MSGSSPQAQPVQLSPNIAPRPSPLFGFAKEFANSYLPQLLNTPFPTYQGEVDPGLSPTMQSLMRQAQTYASSPVPQSLEQTSGTLGAFQNFDKLPGSDFQYQMDPSHQSMYNFQKPALQMPTQAQGPSPDYGFNVKPMARGGAGGQGAGDIMAMANGGAAGPSGWDILDQPVEVDGYYYDQGGLTFNPNKGGGRLGDSKWGNIWSAIQGFTGFTPGDQHGPNAQFWDAIPPAGTDYGRGGATNPTDLMDPNATGYGWWSADPGANGMNMPPWLAGLNDEQMAQVFDLVGNIPPGMRQPSDHAGQSIVGEELMDWGGGPNVRPPGGGGGKRGGGGGGGPNLSFSGIPGYAPTQVESSFVEWDPGNATPSMTAPQMMSPEATPDFFSPPPAAPPGQGGGGGRGGRGGSGGRGGGGGGGQAPGGGIPPWLMALLQQPPQGAPQSAGPGPSVGGGGMRPGGRMQGVGGGSPMGGTKNEVPFFAKGSVVDHPQLAMIGEAGPEVVLPLTREAADPRLQKMQQQLGLPAKPMATGGAAGMSRMPPSDFTTGMAPTPMPQRSPESFGSIAGGGLQSLPSIPGDSRAPTRPGFGGRPGIQTDANFNALGNKPMPMPQRQPSRPGNLLGNKPMPMPTMQDPGSPQPGFAPSSEDLEGRRMFKDWSNATGNQQGLGYEDFMKPSQANWFKDQWRGGGQNEIANKPAPGRPGGAPPDFTTGMGGPPSFSDKKGILDPNAPAGFSSIPAGPQSNGMTAAPGQGGPAGPTSIWDVYNSSVPVMNDIMTQQIQQAAAAGGATGNRFGTSTERNFADIGRQAGNQLTSQFSNMLYNQTQTDLDRALRSTEMGLEDSRFRNQLGFQGQQNALDRALQAGGMGMQAGAMQDQMMQDRLRLPFQMGSWEQGRQDQYSMLPYEEFMNSRLGFLPQIMNMVGGQGGAGGMQGQWGVQQSGGSPGWMDYAGAFAPYLSLFMAEGGAAGHGAQRLLGSN